MTNRAFDIVLLKRPDDTWGSDALALPKARLLSVTEATGQPLSYSLKEDATVAVNSAASSLVGRLELPEELVAQSALDQAKLTLDREKLEIEERAGRRTLWAALATAILSSLATVVVAFITHLGASTPSAPKAYQDLVECREDLTRLASLAQLEQQTLPKLREAVSHSVGSCRERLNTAISASRS
jgi:hypothetical protein